MTNVQTYVAHRKCGTVNCEIVNPGHTGVKWTLLSTLFIKHLMPLLTHYALKRYCVLTNCCSKGVDKDTLLSIYRHSRSESTLAQIMACCLTTPNHYLNRCWLLISEVLWHLPETNFTMGVYATILHNSLEYYTFKIIDFTKKVHPSLG